MKSDQLPGEKIDVQHDTISILIGKMFGFYSRKGEVYLQVVEILI